jgi:hypothetical protein
VSRRSHTVRLHEVQQEESALRFSVESVTSDAKRDFNRKDASLDLVLESINMVRLGA